MKQKLTLLFFLSVFFFSNTIHAQSCDPWIQQIYKQLYNRSATAEECNIRNYNNGSWNSYDELVNYIKSYNTKKASLTATSCDPWITQIYKQLYNRTPSAEECNIKNYNNGSWNSYDQLVSYIKSYNNKKTTSQPVKVTQLKGDAWIFQLYKELYNRQPNAWELNIKNYNNGSWDNYAQLKTYIQQYQNALKQNNIEIKTGTMGDKDVVWFYVNGKPEAVNLVSRDAGSVIAAGGDNVIAAGGGNLIQQNGGYVIAPGGANVVAPGGANVIAPGGGNVIAPGGANLISSNMAGVTFGSGYRIASQNGKVIRTSGKTTLIIHK
jgi:hypothetical protein